MVKEDMYVGMTLIDELFPEIRGVLMKIENGVYDVHFEYDELFGTDSYDYRESDLRFLHEVKLQDYIDAHPA